MFRLLLVGFALFIYFSSSAQLRTLPPNVRLEQTLNELKSKNLLEELKNSEYRSEDAAMSVFKYAGDLQLPLIPFTSTDSLLVFTDKTDTVRHILIAFHFNSEKYLDTLWTLFPKESKYLEVYGRESGSGASVGYEYICRYRKFIADLMINVTAADILYNNLRGKSSAVLVLSARGYAIRRRQFFDK